MARVVGDFWNNEIPSFTWSESEDERGLQISLPQKTGHWSALMEEIRGRLGRELTKDEVTVLSLSRYFGPTPALECGESQKVFQFLFPDGNGIGGWIEWDELANKFQEFIG